MPTISVAQILRFILIAQIVIHVIRMLVGIVPCKNLVRHTFCFSRSEERERASSSVESLLKMLLHSYLSDRAVAEAARYVVDEVRAVEFDVIVTTL